MKKALRSLSGTEKTAGEAADALLEKAAALGFELVSYQTDADQTVWEWRQGEGPRPQFVTERVARQWMSEWLESHPDLRAPEPLDERRRVRTDETGTAPTVAESA